MEVIRRMSTQLQQPCKFRVFGGQTTSDCLPSFEAIFPGCSCRRKRRDNASLLLLKRSAVAFSVGLTSGFRISPPTPPICRPTLSLSSQCVCSVCFGGEGLGVCVFISSPSSSSSSSSSETFSISSPLLHTYPPPYHSTPATHPLPFKASSTGSLKREVRHA